MSLPTFVYSITPLVAGSCGVYFESTVIILVASAEENGIENSSYWELHTWKQLKLNTSASRIRITSRAFAVKIARFFRASCPSFERENMYIRYASTQPTDTPIATFDSVSEKIKTISPSKGQSTAETLVIIDLYLKLFFTTSVSKKSTNATI